MSFVKPTLKEWCNMLSYFLFFGSISTQTEPTEALSQATVISYSPLFTERN